MKNPVAKFLLVAAVTVALFVAALSAFGTDINKGYAFTPTDRVTNVKLNNLVDLATINTDFIHLLTAVAPVSSDELIIYQPSSGLFRKVTASTFLLANTNLIMGQTEDTAPATNDFIVTYDTSAGVFKRVALFNALPLSGFNEMVIPPDIGFKLYITSNGVPYWTSMTNLHQQVYRHYQLANPSNSVSDPTNYFLSANTAPKATDALLLWSGNTNKYTTLSGLVTNLAAAGTPADSDLFYTFNAATAQPRKMTVSQLSFKVYNDYVAGITYTKATLGPFPLSANTNVIVNAAHGLGGTPQLARWVLIQTNTTDAGWGQNREVDIGSFTFTDGTPWYATEVDGTAAVLVGRNGKGDCQVRSGVDGVLTAISTNNWNAKVYLIKFP